MCSGFDGVSGLDSHATVSPPRWTFSYSIGVRIPKGAVTPLTVVEDLQVLEIAFASSMRVRHFMRLSISVCMRPQNDSITELSKQSPIEPIDATSPDSWERRVKAHDVN